MVIYVFHYALTILQRVLFIDYIILCYFIRKQYLNLSYKLDIGTTLFVIN
ncbi:hypothetical protein BGAPBR_E0034 (plasmid) [Borreliella garinii PBr]|uniref:Uncharacterized protein n=1 Tax=Borreliella garinii PBr TaxID=498743 RepID=B8F0L4_BORGR|nr:hypothetical protein BGAPBR_E0034 [Borreliella garinii PBr]